MSKRYHHGLISRIRASGNDIAWVIDQFPPISLEWSPSGEWAATDVLCHLRDAEYGINLHRLQTAVLEDNPEFTRFDTAAWRTLNRPDQQDVDEVVADFLSGRRLVASLLERLDEADWHRPAHSLVFGPSTVEDIAGRAYGHTLDHQRQLVDLLRQARSAGRQHS